MDPIQTEIIRSRLAEAVDSMLFAMFRTGYSTIVRESKDTSAAITDADGRLIAQSTQHGFHIGVFSPFVAAVLTKYPLAAMQPGDVFLANDPYIASPHAPDFILASPAFVGDRVVGFCANIAHKSDIGGMVPGSSSGAATELFHEGVILPVVRYCRAGEIDADLEDILRANSRTPRLMLGDVHGQMGCTQLGCRALAEICREFGVEVVVQAFDDIVAATRRQLGAAIADWPDGSAEAAGYIDCDGHDLEDPVEIRLRLTKDGGRLGFDFSGSSAQRLGPINLRPTLVRAVCTYALIALADPELPINDGVADLVDVCCPEGSVVNAQRPAAVNHYTSALSLICSLATKTIGLLVPDRAVAASGGKITIAIGQFGQSRYDYVQYEIIGSAFGGRPTLDGASGVDPDYANCKITPVEVVETEFPVRLREFRLRTDSGGPGRFRGGLGCVREYELLTPATFTLRGSQHRFPSWGVRGGRPGATSRTVVDPGTERERVLPTLTGGLRLPAGTVIRIERAGGGGWGDPAERPVESVVRDVADGYVSLMAASTDYGVAVRLGADGRLEGERQP